MKALARTAPCFLALLTSFGCTDESNVRYVPSNVADSVTVTYYENFVEVELESDGAATLDTLVQITGVLVYQGDVYLLADNGVTTAFFTPNGGLEGRMASSVVFAKEDTILFAGQQKFVEGDEIKSYIFLENFEMETRIDSILCYNIELYEGEKYIVAKALSGEIETYDFFLQSQRNFSKNIECRSGQPIPNLTTEK